MPDKSHEGPKPKHPPGRGPKERELASALTLAALQAASSSVTFGSLDEAGDALQAVSADAGYGRRVGACRRIDAW